LELGQQAQANQENAHGELGQISLPKNILYVNTSRC